MTNVREIHSAPDAAISPESAGGALEQSEVARLIETQYRGLINLVRSKLRDRELAADLVNEAIVVTLEHAKNGRLARTDQLGGYVFTVSMNLLRNYQRNSDNRRDLRSSVDELNTVAVHDRDITEENELQRKAQQVIESLASPRDREVVKRFYLDEEDKQAICDHLGLTPLQFTQVMSRARQRMKAIFDTQGLTRRDLLTLLLVPGLFTVLAHLIHRVLTTSL